MLDRRVHERYIQHRVRWGCVVIVVYMNTFQSGIASSLMDEVAEKVAWNCVTTVCLHLDVAMEICLTKRLSAFD